MEWLNYHHLLYFWVAAREGGIGKASAKLRLAHPTVSGQIKALEAALGEKLFARAGRGVVLTEMGRLVFRYADEIFSLGRELLDTVQGRPTGRPIRLAVGIADVVPKLIARRLLEPALHLGEPVHIVCREDRPERLLAELALHSLDVILTDAPAPAAGVQAYSHLLGESGVSFFAVPRVAARYRAGFPASLEGAPMLLPTDNTSLRRSLDQWLEAQGVRPRIVGEFEDSALLTVFGQDGIGIFPAAAAISDVVRRQYRVELVGTAAGVHERFYALSVERRLKHPAVVAISDAARQEVFRQARSRVSRRAERR